ncbi:cyclophilin-like fold protein [Vibrio porteresiae]|uniref:Cyclophilin-like fold protein n=1 Tax=Vibrio porteresiae DSM 19223 TaxID=1123496 RepID=A0ABZ0QIK6_9VIBR|nr:cyclophilin-like fold protein [Vibrio porteresiae]WPC76333.1 cyclophilin-like fold protein [Vibrio porteresiae DSM 19223]
MPTPIILKCQNTVIPATLNDSVAAQDFRKRIPFKTSGYRSTFDYCCTAKEGKFDPAEKQHGWKNGDISLAGGWFAVLFSGEEQSASYGDIMVIAHIDDEHLHLVEGLSADVTFTVALA